MKKIIILIVIICVMVSGCSNNRDGLLSSVDNDNNAYLEPSPTDIPETKEPTPEIEAEAETEEESPFKDMNVYYEGQYKVGTDIPSGEYMVMSTNGSGYFSVTSDANGNDIVFNSNFDVNSIITINDKEYLELSRSFAIPAEEFYSKYKILTNSSGIMLKIGTDISAGEYKLKSTSDSGYYCVYDSSRHENIVSNNNFSGNNYVTVNDGEYLELSRCLIVD